MNDGVLLLNKHAGVTSHDMIYRVRRAMGTRQVGHAGTLDPMAEGVLVILVGRAAKACEYLSHDEKKYRARLRLGMTTDTEDISGTCLSRSDFFAGCRRGRISLRRVCRRQYTNPPHVQCAEGQRSKIV